jgi:hypothetical protein
MLGHRAQPSSSGREKSLPGRRPENRAGGGLHSLCRQEFHHRGGGVDQGIIPVQEPLLRQHDGPLLFENLEESGKGSLDVRGVDGEILIEYAICIPENEDLLLRFLSMDFFLQKAWLALLHPLLLLLLCLRGVEGYGRLIHSHNIVPDCQRVMPKELNELLAALDSLIFCAMDSSLSTQQANVFTWQDR